MSDPTTKKPKGGNPAMRKGAPSLNPKGRPRLGTSLAEALRAKLPAEEHASMLVDLATKATSEQVRLSALLAIGDRAHGKVTDHLAVDPGVVSPHLLALLEAARMTPHERRRALDELGLNDDETVES
jgi:hypothetical protein